MTEIVLAIYLAALNTGVPPNLAISVAVVESRLNPEAVGTLDDVGLFQIRERFVPETRKELLNAETNINRGTRLLAHAKTVCSNDLGNAWLLCHNFGVVGAKRLGRVEAKNTKYVKRVTKVYQCLKGNTYKDYLEGLDPRSCL
jgi:soluble lytic murein transglycosylase-like protein